MLWWNIGIHILKGGILSWSREALVCASWTATLIATFVALLSKLQDAWATMDAYLSQTACKRLLPFEKATADFGQSISSKTWRSNSFGRQSRKVDILPINFGDTFITNGKKVGQQKHESDTVYVVSHKPLTDAKPC